MGIKGNIDIIAISDIHIGAAHTKSEDILIAMRYWLTTNQKRINKADLFVISGDFWDRLLPQLSSDITNGIRVMSYIFMACEKANIPLRLLEGTRLHEWGQSAILDPLKLSYDVDYKHISHVSIEYMESISRHILYVPDDVCSVRSDVEPIINKCLSEHDLLSVDIAIIHTQFPHQLPDNLGIDFSDPDYYSRIVDEVIISGHIHDFCIFDKIVTPGSFDRNTFAEDKDVGGVLISITPESTTKFSVKRLLNTKATLYKTIRVPKQDQSKNITKRIRALLKGYSGNGNIRLAGGDVNVVETLLDTLKTQYPSIRFVKKKDKVKESDKVIPLPTDIRNIRKLQMSTLPDTIRSNLNKRHIPQDMINRVMSLLGVFKDEYNSR